MILAGTENKNKVNRGFRYSYKKITILIALILVIASVLISALSMTLSNPNAFSSGAIKITDLTINKSGDLFVYVQNVGTTTVNFDSSNCVYVNGELQNCSIIQNNPLLKDQFAKIAVAYKVQANDPVNVKVLTSTGVSAQNTKIITQVTENGVQITVASNPSSFGFVKVDGVTVTTPIIEGWSPGSIHKLEALSHIPGSDRIQYTWAEWSDHGSQTHSYTVPDSSQTVTATYQSQYQVTFSVNSAEGIVNPSGSNWHNAATIVPISAVAKLGYSFSSWTESGSIAISNISSGSTSATINGPGTVTANFVSSSANNIPQPSATPVAPSSVSITISSNPSGSGFVKVDGTMQATPYTVSWSVGSTHTLEALSNVKSGNDVQYIWTGWSNGATQLNTYTVPSSNAAITANYKTQYLFILKTNGLPSSYLTDVTVGVQRIGYASDGAPLAEWLDASSTTGTIRVDQIISGVSGTQYVFTNWTPDSSTANPRSSTPITSPLTLTANYKTQYQVTFNANPSVAGTTNPAGTGWYNAASQLTISADANSVNQFAFWNKTGNITITSSSSIFTTATIDSSGTITANYQSTIAYITITSNPPELFQNGQANIIVDGYAYSTYTPFSWIIGENLTLEAPSNVSMGTGIQYTFNSWSNGAPRMQNYIPSSNATLTVTFSKQYYLTLNSVDQSIVSGGGWYNVGSSVTIYTASPVVGASERYFWSGWTGSGTGSYTGTGNNSALVTMNSPITENASWTHQYQISAKYSTSDASTPSANVVLSGTQFSSALPTFNLGTTTSNLWLDAGSTWSVNTQISTSPTTEQWIAMTGTSGNVSSSTNVQPTYSHQYKLSFNLSSGGTMNCSGTNVWINAGSLGILAIPNTGVSFLAWSYNGTGTVTFANPQSAVTSATIGGSGTITATFAVTITVSAGANGQITPGTGTVNYGATPTYTITPNTGYHIASITVNGGSVAITSPKGQSYQFASVTSNNSIAATFSIDTFTITVSAGANGHLTPTTGPVNYGSTPAYTITPDTGYLIASITVDGQLVSVTNATGQSYQFSAISAAHTISATFAVVTYTITVAAGPNGQITPGTGIVNYGTTPTYTITPNTGYHIASITVDGKGVSVINPAGQNYQFSAVSAPHTISATFAINT